MEGVPRKGESKGGTQGGGGATRGFDSDVSNLKGYIAYSNVWPDNRWAILWNASRGRRYSK